MRISDLLACDVHTADGRRIGRVRDVRLVMDGPLQGVLARLRVDAVVVGGSAVGGRLGYGRGGVRGPALVAVVMRGLAARAIAVDADDIAEWDLDGRRLVLVPGAPTHGDQDR